MRTSVNFTEQQVKTALQSDTILHREPIKAELDGLFWGGWIVAAPRADRGKAFWYAPSGSAKVRCPYDTGDVLAVRETWADNIAGCPNGISYRADHIDPQGDGNANPIKWKSAAIMPRWASRLSVQVEAVGVEQTDNGWEWVITLRKIPTP